MRINSVGRFFAPSLEDPAYVARRLPIVGHQFGGTNAPHGVESMTRSVSASGAAMVLILLSGSSTARNNPSPASGTVEGSSALPVAGAYGFIESQAKSRLESSGYKNISGLEKNNSGNWRGQAEKNGLPSAFNCSARNNLSSRKGQLS
jgi:hypothetical protein